MYVLHNILTYTTNRLKCLKQKKKKKAVYDQKQIKSYRKLVLINALISVCRTTDCKITVIII